MDKYEMYMIDTLKYWADKVNKNVDTEDYLMCLNVFEELSDVYVAYKNVKVGVSVNSYLQDDVPGDLNSISA